MLATVETHTIPNLRTDRIQIEQKIITIFTNWLIINEDSDTAKQETKSLLRPLWIFEESINRTMYVLNRDSITYDKISSYIKNLKIK